MEQHQNVGKCPKVSPGECSRLSSQHACVQVDSSSRAVSDPCSQGLPWASDPREGAQSLARLGDAGRCGYKYFLLLR